MSKFQPYYSSSRLTLLLMLLDLPPNLDPYPNFLADIIPLPTKLKAIDNDAHGLHTFFSAFYHPRMEWDILRDFLDSRHPLALDGQRHATATLACLKMIFRYDQAPHSWCTLRVDQHSQRHGADLKPKTLWHRSVTHWYLRTYLSSQKSQKIPQTFWEFCHKIQVQRLCLVHLIFLLEKSPYSDNLVNFTHHRVFRFRHIQ